MSVEPSFYSLVMRRFPVIAPNDHLWLEAIYAENGQNRKLTTPQIRSRLRDHLPRNYDPLGIDRRLIQANHEEITLLGIVAVTGNDDILEKADLIIRTLQDILLDEPDLQRVDTVDIANRCGQLINEIGLLCRFLYSYGKPFQSYGSQTPGYFGAEFVVFDRYNTDSLMQFPGMRALLLAELDPPDQEMEDGEESPLPQTGLQVLALHYLLKACGIESSEHKTAAARLAQFLTGREMSAGRIQDTTLYKKVSSPFKLNDQAVLQDLQAIRPLFVNLGLNKAVELIDREIRISQGE